MKKKPREFWLAMPGENYDGCPGAWPAKELAERSTFILSNDKFGLRFEGPSEVIHVKEVLSEISILPKGTPKKDKLRGLYLDHTFVYTEPKRSTPTKRRPNAKRARKKDL